MSRVSPALALLLLVAAESPAWAGAKLEGNRGLDLRLFRPSVDADGYLTVNGTRSLRPGQVGFSIAVDAGFELLKLDASLAGTRESELAIVDSVTTAVATVNAGVYDGVLVGASFFFQGASGPPASVPDVYGGSEPDPGLRANGAGDVEVHTKVRLLDSRRNGFGVAALARMALPTGDSREFRGEPGVAVTPSIAAEIAALSVFRAGAEVGYRWVNGTGAAIPFSGGTVEYDDQLAFGVAASLALSSRISVVIDSYGTAVVRAFGEKDALSLELAGGLKYQITDYVGVLGGGAFGPVPGIRGARGRVFSALNIAPSASDFDGDGYSTEDDACPSAAEDFDHFEDSDGCPDLDDDQDGVPDATDECPTDVEDFDGVDDFDGCPEREIPDSDGNGVDDYPTDLRERRVKP